MGTFTAQRAHGVALSRDGKRLAISTQRSEIDIWIVKLGDARDRWPARLDACASAAWL